ncbi:MAG: SDR family oxidoreductase [Ferruginibacter sp.]|nr:SDR family oxidoreductase [Cytophagales bacterium]
MNFTTAEKRRLKEKYGSWAIITGASSGIGKELSERVAESGLNVLLVARRKDLLDELASGIKNKYRVQARTLAADLSEENEATKVINESKNFDIGLLIASAGFGTSGSFVDSSLEDEINMVKVNCTALLMFTHHFTKVFKQRKKGGIILLSSLVGFQGVPFAANYAATKAYVQSLAEALNAELKPSGIDVLAAAPGPVLSGFSERSNMVMGAALKPSDVAIPILKALGRKATVLPGLLTKVLVYSLATVPRWGKIMIMKAVMGGMTKHQRAN